MLTAAGGRAFAGPRCAGTHSRVKTLAVALLAGVLASSCADIECSRNSDCGDRARCDMNRCVRDCREDRDCAEGSTCNPNGLCVKSTPTDDRPEVVDAPVSVDRGFTPADGGVDAGTDAGFDVGRDAGFDVGAPDVGAPDAVAGPVAVGVYEYTGVRPEALVAPVAAAWHPGGGYALILSASNTVFRYDPGAGGGAVTQVAMTARDVSWRGVSFTPDGARALLLANTGSGTTVRGRIFIWDHASSTLAERTAEAWAMGSYQSLRWSPDGRRAVLLGSGTSSLTIWRYDSDGTRGGVPMGYGLVSGTGCNDLAWVADGFGDPALAVVCGTNTGGILSVTGIDAATPRFTTAAMSSATGNVHRIAGRPQGDAALAVGSSSQKLYRYRDGVWSTGFFSPELRGAFGVSFSSDGARALAFGGFGRAHEYRYDLYVSAEIVDVSIGGLAAAPYTQPTNAQLNDVAWRPGCHEGLAVGGANSFSGTTAFVAYFRVLNGVRCQGGL